MSGFSVEDYPGLLVFERGAQSDKPTDTGRKPVHQSVFEKPPKAGGFSSAEPPSHPARPPIYGALWGEADPKTIQWIVFPLNGRGVRVAAEPSRTHSQIAPMFEEIENATLDILDDARKRFSQLQACPIFAACWLIPRLQLFCEAEPTLDLHPDTKVSRPEFEQTYADVFVLLGEGTGRTPGRESLWPRKPIRCASGLRPPPGSGNQRKREPVSRFENATGKGIRDLEANRGRVHAASEPARVYRRVIDSSFKRLYHWRSAFHGKPPLLLLV